MKGNHLPSAAPLDSSAVARSSGAAIKARAGSPPRRRSRRSWTSSDSSSRTVSLARERASRESSRVTSYQSVNVERRWPSGPSAVPASTSRSWRSRAPSSSLPASSDPSRPMSARAASRRGSPSSASIRLAASTWSRVDGPLVSKTSTKSPLTPSSSSSKATRMLRSRSAMTASPRDSSFSMSQNSPG